MIQIPFSFFSFFFVTNDNFDWEPVVRPNNFNMHVNKVLQHNLYMDKRTKRCLIILTVLSYLSDNGTEREKL